MSYRYSNLDNENYKWFNNHNAVASLASIQLLKGNIRGLKPFDISFKYPITAISGVNGSGKSTILALAACAYHNNNNGYVPSLRKQAYYTFKDFFIQSSDEITIDGINILYSFRHNKWRRSDPGIGFQKREKRQNGRWNDYKVRVSRNVIYFGVQRVVPYFERSVHTSYRNRFSPGIMDEKLNTKIATIAGRIIGKTYTKFENLEHTKYSLPNVTVSGSNYSGFNMGAGESAVFEILTALFQAGKGTLLIIDELELGLHESAQRILIKELKKLCLDLKCQVICSTHSHAILSSLPPEANFYINSVGDNFSVLAGVSADYACGNMGRTQAQELDIFVEDNVAKSILNTALNLELRKRCKIITIGSCSAVARQLCSRLMEGKDNCIAYLDGDQKACHKDTLKIIVKLSEASTEAKRQEVEDWANKRICYLPGDTWPEKWILISAHSKSKQVYLPESPDETKELISRLRVPDKPSLTHLIDEALKADQHNEFFELSEAVGLEEADVKNELIRFVMCEDNQHCNDIKDTILEQLD